MKRFLFILLSIVVFFGLAIELFYFGVYKTRTVKNDVAEVMPSKAQGLGHFSRVPDFNLIDQHGGAVQLKDLKGKVWLANFIYTTCPSTCPALTSRLAEWQAALAPYADVRLVSFSVDPIHDTPALLREYAERFHASDRWSFLTGNDVQLRQITKEGFLLSFDGQEPQTSGTGAGKGVASPEITHSTKIALVDRHGFVRRFYDGEAADEREAMLADVQTLLKEP